MPAIDPAAFRAQHGEDRVLAREFSNGDGYFVEVGSYNGESYSNTWFLEKTLGWKGTLIEADPSLHAQGEKKRAASKHVNCAVVAPGSPGTVSFEIVDGCRWVSSLSVRESMLKRIDEIPTQVQKVVVVAKTLDQILDEVAAPTGFEFLSIDVEGHEWPVLQGFSLPRWKPRIIIVERNDHFPDRRIMRHMRLNGYGWRRTTGCNDWFYAGDALQLGYTSRLIRNYYVPKYLTLYRPIVHGPLKRLAKRILRNLGLLDWLRSRLNLRGATNSRNA